MSTLQQKITRHTKRLKQTNKTSEFEETKQASEPDWDMAGMLELSDQEFENYDYYAKGSSGEK